MSDCCSTEKDASCVLPDDTDSVGVGLGHLIIVGGGSAAFAAALKAVELGGSATIINGGLPMGGTCVNVGCVPSKTLIRAAETLHKAQKTPFRGIEVSGRLTSFAEVMADKQALVDDMRQQKYYAVVRDQPGIRLVEGRARLLNDRTVRIIGGEADGEQIAGDRILIATGVRPSVPPVVGLADTPYLTNESAFELEELPESLIVLGGRYVALELAQIFARLGSRVTVLQRSVRILPDQESDLTEALSAYLRDEGIEIITGVGLNEVEHVTGGFVVHTTVSGHHRTFTAEQLLVATGRVPNTGELGLEEVGAKLDEKGFVSVNEQLETSVPGIYAAGDVIGGAQFVYTAAYEGSLAAANALGNSPQERDYSALGWVVFTDPQVAGIGYDEAQARAAGIDADSALLPLGYVPRAVAARDTRGFIKLIRNRADDRLVGARILAPEGSELLMEVATAIRFGITVSQLRSLFHPYLTLGEGIKLAAITFGKDVSQLSCCAT